VSVTPDKEGCFLLCQQLFKVMNPLCCVSHPCTGMLSIVADGPHRKDVCHAAGWSDERKDAKIDLDIRPWIDVMVQETVHQCQFTVWGEDDLGTLCSAVRSAEKQ